MPIYNKDGSAIYNAYSPSGNRLMAAYKADGTRIPLDRFLPTAIITQLPAVDIAGNKQGACTDGTYIYQIIIGTSFSFVKYRISDGTYSVVSVGSSIPYNHGNDMTYNPNNQHLYVASMSDDGAVMELDTNFNYITTHYLVKPDGVTHYAVWALCYNQNTREFFSLTSGPSVAVYDESFNYVRSIPMPAVPSATAQGMETDGEYIYRVWYRPNLIDVATMDGDFVTQINNPMSGEPEALMFDWLHDKYYMNKNTSTDLFWEIQLKQE